MQPTESVLTVIFPLAALAISAVALIFTIVYYRRTFQASAIELDDPKLSRERTFDFDAIVDGDAVDRPHANCIAD